MGLETVQAFRSTHDPYKSLKTTFKTEIDEEAWESLYRDVSRAFVKPRSGRSAVKLISHFGDEVMKGFRVERFTAYRGCNGAARLCGSTTAEWIASQLKREPVLVSRRVNKNEVALADGVEFELVLPPWGENPTLKYRKRVRRQGMEWTTPNSEVAQ